MPITANYGEITYHDDDRIEVPINFEAVVHVLKVSDAFISGVDLIDSYVEGEDRLHTLFLTPKENSHGTLEIDLTGRVYTDNEDNTDVILDTIDAQIISINYDTREPDIIARLLPSSITAGINRVYLEINRDIINITPQSFIADGVDITPRLYAAESLGDNYVEYTNSEEPRRYFRLDYELPNPPHIGSLNIRLKKGNALGYVNKIPRLRDRVDTSSQRTRRQVFGQQAPPSIASSQLTDADLYLLEDFRKDIVISNASSLTKVYVEGLLRGWTYEWADSKKESLAIVADANDITNIESGIWAIRLVYGAQSRTYTINWTVNQRAPIITNPGFQTFYKDANINLDIPITQNPSVSMDGLLSKMKYARQETGAKLSGSPDRLVARSENRKIIINASTSGGSDREEFGFSIEELPELTGGFEFIATITEDGAPTSVVMAYDEKNDIMYALGRSSRKIYTLDVTTGVLTRVGNVANFGLLDYERINCISASFDNNTGTLYVAIRTVDRRSADILNNLYIMNTSTARASVRAGSRNFGIGRTVSFSGIAYNNQNNILYGANDGDDYMYTINTSNSGATRLFYFGGTDNQARGMAYDNFGDLYMLANQTGALFKVNLSARRLERVGNVRSFGITSFGGPLDLVYHSKRQELLMNESGSGRRGLYRALRQA